MSYKHTVAVIAGLMLIGVSVAPYVGGALRSRAGNKHRDSICSSLERIAKNEGVDEFPMIECRVQFGKLASEARAQPERLDVLGIYADCLTEADNFQDRDVCGSVAEEKERSLYQ